MFNSKATILFLKIKDYNIEMAQPNIPHNQGAKEFAELRREGVDLSESWLIRVQKRFESRQYKMFQPTSNVSIYRVPQSMMASKPQAYVPLVVSFGFYHHKKEEDLSVMDDHKLEAVERTLKRLNNMDIYMLTAEIEKLEQRIRECYQDSAIEYGRETVAWMLTMDACFILEFFRALSKDMSNGEQSFSLIFQRGDGNAISWAIKRDIIKLENQIPLFVLIHLLQLELKTHERAISKLATILSHFQEFKGFPFSLEVWEDQIPSKIEEHVRKGACHLLDLCRMLIVDFLTHSGPCSPSFALSIPKNQNNNDKLSKFSAELLRNVGISFKSSVDGKLLFENSRFGSSYFFPPKIIMGDDTETILRNLIAFDECQRCRSSPEATIISQYIGLIDDLIDSEKDVALLRNQEIIISLMGRDSEIGGMFHDLDREVSIQPIEQFQVVVKQITDHYHSVLNLWIRQFKEEYCSRPWYILSLLMAILVLGMTAVQTYFGSKAN